MFTKVLKLIILANLLLLRFLLLSSLVTRLQLQVKGQLEFCNRRLLIMCSCTLLTTEPLA